MKRLLAAIAASLLLSTAANAAKFYRYDEWPTTFGMRGPIEPGDGKGFLESLNARDYRGATTTYILLDSPGGSIYEAYVMAAEIRKRNLVTVVDASGTCASACMLMFAAGAERRIWAGAQLGVHSASSMGSADADGNPIESGKGMLYLAQDMARYGTPDSIIALMAVTPASDMAWFTEQQVAGWVTVMRPQTDSKPTAVTMNCWGQKGFYPIVWSTGQMTLNGKPHPINDAHQHASGAWVVSGPTRYGGYSAVFGGPNPRIEFWDGKVKVTDKCYK